MAVLLFWGNITTPPTQLYQQPNQQPRFTHYIINRRAVEGIIKNHCKATEIDAMEANQAGSGWQPWLAPPRRSSTYHNNGITNERPATWPSREHELSNLNWGGLTRPPVSTSAKNERVAVTNSTKQPARLSRIHTSSSTKGHINQHPNSNSKRWQNVCRPKRCNNDHISVYSEGFETHTPIRISPLMREAKPPAIMAATVAHWKTQQTPGMLIFIQQRQQTTNTKPTPEQERKTQLKGNTDDEPQDTTNSLYATTTSSKGLPTGNLHLPVKQATQPQAAQNNYGNGMNSPGKPHPNNSQTFFYVYEGSRADDPFWPQEEEKFSQASKQQPHEEEKILWDQLIINTIKGLHERPQHIEITMNEITQHETQAQWRSSSTFSSHYQRMSMAKISPNWWQTGNGTQ